MKTFLVAVGIDRLGGVMRARQCRKPTRANTCRLGFGRKCHFPGLKTTCIIATLRRLRCNRTCNQAAASVNIFKIVASCFPIFASTAISACILR